MNVKLVQSAEFLEFDAKDEYLSDHCQLFPLIHQILTNPKAHHRFPMAPTGPFDPAFWMSVRYWECCYYFLRVILGWADPGAGLLWYFQNRDKDSSDYRITVLKALWDNENQLDLLAAWILRNGDQYTRGLQLSGLVKKDEVPEPRSSAPSNWWNEFDRKYPEGKTRYAGTPFHGGSNPLHLPHFAFVFEESPCNKAYLLQSDAEQRTATLILDNVDGWYAALVKHGSGLADIGDRSWHVDVFTKTMGYLGRFRQSRETGLWFHGKHSFHAVGNTHQQ